MSLSGSHSYLHLIYSSNLVMTTRTEPLGLERYGCSKTAHPAPYSQSPSIKEGHLQDPALGRRTTRAVGGRVIRTERTKLEKLGVNGFELSLRPLHAIGRSKPNGGIGGGAALGLGTWTATTPMTHIPSMKLQGA